MAFTRANRFATCVAVWLSLQVFVGTNQALSNAAVAVLAPSAGALSTLLNPAAILVTEKVTVGDVAQLVPSVVISVSEIVTLTDTATTLPSVLIVVSEPVAITDTAQLVPSILIRVTQPIIVTDTIDSAAPRTTATAVPSANGAGWNREPVTLTLSAVDQPETAVAVGVREIVVTSTGATTGTTTYPGASAAVTISAEGTTTVTYFARDNNGNQEAAGELVLKVDTIPPTIAGERQPVANGFGWNNTGVTVTFTCSDATSGLSSCTAPVTLGDDGAGQSVSGTAVDQAGNSSTTSVGGINIDATSPLVTYTGNSGTYAVDQTIAIYCVAADVLSGLASQTCADISGPAYAFPLGANTFTATATDKADNSATATVQFTVGVTPASLCTLTQEFVQSSARYQALPPSLRARADTLTDRLCAQVDALSSQLTPAQRSAVIAAYRRGVDGLVALGWLTTAQATILKTLAGGL